MRDAIRAIVGIDVRENDLGARCSISDFDRAIARARGHADPESSGSDSDGDKAGSAARRKARRRTMQFVMQLLRITDNAHDCPPLNSAAPQLQASKARATAASRISDAAAVIPRKRGRDRRDGLGDGDGPDPRRAKHEHPANVAARGGVAIGGNGLGSSIVSDPDPDPDPDYMPPTPAARLPASASAGGGMVAVRPAYKWTPEEKAAYLVHFAAVGKDWRRMHELIPTKTVSQIKNYYQNYKIRYGLDKMALRVQQKASRAMPVRYTPSSSSPALANRITRSRGQW